MSRLLAAVKVDATVQVRNYLYNIGIFVGLLTAGVLAWLATPGNLHRAVPTLMLLVVGGSTLIYVGGMIMFERDEGTLRANIVSPLRAGEYLRSKVLTLTLLATVEALVMVGGALAILRWRNAFALPSVPLLLLGIIGMGAIYTLVGIIMIVRYDSITRFLIPVALVAMVLQLPAIYFLDIAPTPLWLLVPTSAPAMLLRGAFVDIAAWQWVYGALYTVALIAGLSVWAYRSFMAHVVRKGA